MSAKLSEQEQSAIIKEVEEKYSKFLDPNFDASIFLKCRDNFTLTEHIESVKIFEMDNAPINPTFTIAIPTYNRCETLKEAIDSALNQDTDENYEIIVVENVDDFDQKTPAQEMLEKEYKGKLTYYKNKENLGMFGNWNRCLTLAKGEWVCMLHSDDILMLNYITCIKNVVRTKINSILIGNLQSKEAKWFSKLYSKIIPIDDLAFTTPIKRPPPSALLHNKHTCINIGGYNPDEYPSSDNMFAYRCLLEGEVYTYRVQLHDKRNDISTENQPKTILEFCMIDTPFILAYTKPHFFGKFFLYLFLSYCQQIFIQNNNNLLSTKINEILEKKELKYWFFNFRKTLKLIYCIIAFCKKITKQLTYFN